VTDSLKSIPYPLAPPQGGERLAYAYHSIDFAQPTYLVPLNVRKTRTKEAIAQMAASIEAQGVLQNLIVHPADDGSSALPLGHPTRGAPTPSQQGKIATDYPVPCESDSRRSDSYRSVVGENFVRTQMSPADEFDAFKKLSDEGQGPETIAARFGVSRPS